MRITFNLQNTGAGPNGGSATLFHSANVLYKLGHKVHIVSDSGNRFHWFPLQGPEFLKIHTDDYPDADVNMATGAGSVKRVLKAPKSKGLKVWWIRGHETWIAKFEDLVNYYKNKKIKKIVNSQCLQQFIRKKTGQEFVVVRPGLDFDTFYSTHKRNWAKKGPLKIGALYTERPSKRFKWLPYVCKSLRVVGIPHKLNLFGSEEDPIAVE